MARQIMTVLFCATSPFLATGVRSQNDLSAALNESSSDELNDTGSWFKDALAFLGMESLLPGDGGKVREVAKKQLYPKGMQRPHPNADGTIVKPSTYWVFAKQVPLMSYIGSFAWHHELLFCLKSRTVDAQTVENLIQHSITKNTSTQFFDWQHYMDKQFLKDMNKLLPQCFTTTFGANTGAQLLGGEMGTADDRVFGHDNNGDYWIYVGSTARILLHSFVIQMSMCGNFAPADYLLLHNNCNFYAKAVLLGLGLPINFETNSKFESQMLPDIGRFDIRENRCVGMRCTDVDTDKQECAKYCTWKPNLECVRH